MTYRDAIRELTAVLKDASGMLQSMMARSLAHGESRL
jgi:hypothetical protein